MPLRSFMRPGKWATFVLTGSFLVGCSTSEKQLSYLGEADLDHYKDVVTSIDYPAVNTETPDEVSYSDEPRRIRNPRKDEVWNLGLEEAIHTALMNNEIIRDNGQFLSPGNRLLSNPDFVQSVYDPALQDSNPLFGQNGPESALSEFDAQFTTNLLVGRTESISTTTGFNGISPGDTIDNMAGDFRSSLSKNFASGGQASLSHNVLYQDFNQGSGTGANRIFGTYFENNPSANQNGGLPGVELGYRHPLWAGAGTKFTRIAGPISRRPTLQNVPQVNQGVVISRIRTDIAIAEFESAVIGLVKDVEDIYWELYLAYRRYDADLVARNSALQAWRQVKSKSDQGLEGGGAAEEAQSRGGYFESRARAEDALANLFNTEGRVRRLLGLPVNDGRIIRPSDEPSTAEFLPDWRSSLVEALCRRVELRKQKWNIKSLELQCEAAQSLTKPRLDFVSRYQINGFGDQLFGSAQSVPTGGGGGEKTASFYDNLLHANQTGWGLGLEFSMPIGFRAAHSQVRNIELKLSKARASLATQEHEISHELANAFRQLDSSFQTAQTNFNRRRAAERQLQAYQEKYSAGQTNIDQLLRSQGNLAQAEIAYYQSVVGYNRSIVELKYRKGTLLEDDNVHLSESLSHPESYVQALRRAWSRSHAFDAPNLDTKPGEFVSDTSDPVEMGTATYSSANGTDQPNAPTPPEPVPANELPKATTAPEANAPQSEKLVPPPAQPKTLPDSANAIEDELNSIVQPASKELELDLEEPEADTTPIQQIRHQRPLAKPLESDGEPIPSEDGFELPSTTSGRPLPNVTDEGEWADETDESDEDDEADKDDMTFTMPRHLRQISQNSRTRR